MEILFCFDLIWPALNQHDPIAIPISIPIPIPTRSDPDPTWLITQCLINHSNHLLDGCMFSPCKNGGVCSPNGFDFECKCKIGWKRNTCNILCSLWRVVPNFQVIQTYLHHNGLDHARVVIVCFLPKCLMVSHIIVCTVFLISTTWCIFCIPICFSSTHMQGACCSGNIGICVFQYLTYAEDLLAEMVVLVMAMDKCITVIVPLLTTEKIARVSII